MTNSLAIIDPAIRSPEVDCYNWIAAHSPAATSYHLPALVGLDSLTPWEPDISGIILLGSEGSVLEHAAWQKKLERWIEVHTFQRKIPTLAICYSHQLIAQMLGGRVSKAPNGKMNIGFRHTVFDGDLFGERVDHLGGPLFVYHEEWVAEAPTELVEIGKSEGFVHDAFVHQSLPLWTVQAHPEATPSFVALSGGQPEPAQLDFGQFLVKKFMKYITTPSANVD